MVYFGGLNRLRNLDLVVENLKFVTLETSWSGCGLTRRENGAIFSVNNIKRNCKTQANATGKTPYQVIPKTVIT